MRNFIEGKTLKLSQFILESINLVEKKVLTSWRRKYCPIEWQKVNKVFVPRSSKFVVVAVNWSRKYFSVCVCVCITYWLFLTFTIQAIRSICIYYLQKCRATRNFVSLRPRLLSVLLASLSEMVHWWRGLEVPLIASLVSSLLCSSWATLTMMAPHGIQPAQFFHALVNFSLAPRSPKVYCSMGFPRSVAVERKFNVTRINCRFGVKSKLAEGLTFRFCVGIFSALLAFRQRTLCDP